MTETHLIGFVRKSKDDKYLTASLLKSALDKCETYETQDGSEYIKLLVRMSGVKLVISGDKEVTSVIHIRE